MFLLLLLGSCSNIYKETLAHRKDYKEGFILDPRSPLTKENLGDLDFFKPTQAGKVEAVFKHTPEKAPFEMLTYSGVTRTYRKYGEAKFVMGGDSMSLSIYQNNSLLSNPMYEDYLFLPFKDMTNDVSTYGGGRYLNISKKDVDDGMVNIDFNKAYNPWCAFSDGFNCPIPPSENHLGIAIEAGEKKYKGPVKKAAVAH